MGDGDGDDVCPYQGLAPFGAENAELFFGRARPVHGLLARLARRLDGHGSILLLSGASGVGKSSLLRAGLMPALEDGRLPVSGSKSWPCRLMTPTARPLWALAECWTDVYGGRTSTVYERLREEPRLPSPEGRLVLVVDQFEDLFTLVTDEQERQAFVAALRAATEGPAGAAVVIGVRADYWERCAAYPELADAIQDGQVLVEPMTEPDLRLAIVGPAAAVGLEIEPGLVETVLADLQAGQGATDPYAAGALPLLSQALRNTWDRREDRRLTLRGYEESGRVRDAVQRTADQVFEGLSATERKAALRVFRRMTVITAGGRVARRRATMAELRAAASADTAELRSRVDALISAFAGRRLITLDENTAEIAHDALLTAWPTLRRWLEPDLLAQSLYDRLVEDAGQWDENRRDPAFLYRGGRLLSVQDSRPRWNRDLDSFPPPGPVVDGFIAASARAARRAGRRRHLVMTGLAGLSVLALIAAVAAVNSSKAAGRQRALAVSRQLAAQSEVAGDPVASRLLAVAAWRIAPTPEARYRMLDAAAHTGRAVLSGHTSSVTELAFSPTGSAIATGSADGTARLWDTDTRRQLGPPITHPQQECSVTGVGAVSFDPEGKVLATACLTTVRFWDTTAHRQVGTPLHSRTPVRAIAFSPDGRTLATAGLDGTTRLWDMPTGHQRGNVLGRPGPDPVNGVTFSPDGRRLATAGADDTARLWDTATRRQIGIPLAGHTGDVQDVSFSPDGTTLATASTDGTARLWNLTTHRRRGAVLRSPSGRSGFNAIAFSPDGTRLATAGADGACRLWDAADHRTVGPALVASRLAVLRVAFSPRGRLVAAAGQDGTVQLGDPLAHQQIGPAIPGAAAVALSPDGRTLATVGPRKADAAVRLWNVTDRRQIGRPLPSADVSRIGFSPDGATVVTSGRDGVLVWDTATQRQVGPPLYEGEPGGLVAFSPDGRLLAISNGHHIRFWDTAGHHESGSRIAVSGFTDFVSGMVFSPDGASLAVAGGDHSVRLFDVVTRSQIGTHWPAATDGFLDALAFSPDGRTLAVTAIDDTVRLWDVTGHRQTGAPLAGHTGRITAIAYSRDGATLVTGSADGTARLWDMATYRQIGIPLTGHYDGVTGIAYSRDGRTVATVGDDGTARLWNVAPPADPVATTCADAGRSLTRDEWKRYLPGERFRRLCN